MVVEVATGRVLAAVEIGARPEDVEGNSLLLDPVSPAASLMKLVTTAALYETTDVTPRLKVCTRGGVRLIEENHLQPQHGPGVSCSPFGHALATSRNAAYAQLAAQKLTPASLRRIASSLGLNRPLLLDASGTVGTLSVPDSGLQFARTAVGFGDSRLSVAGAAQLALTIAAGGKQRAMHLAMRPSDAPGSIPEVEPQVLTATTVRRLTRAMEMTVEFGTAAEVFRTESGAAYLPGISVAGKTGTLRPSETKTTSSWFTGFAPSQRPEIVVSVVLLNSDLWHQKGNSIARDIFRAYFASQGHRGVTPPL
jgi:cell division protein FtsI/penicillin-binding protein 2